MTTTLTAEDKATIREFKELVNMTPKTLERWLASDESKQVGQKKAESDESIGHASGRRIIKLLGMKMNEYADDDLAHMRKVISYIRRHTAQKPEGDIAETPWRYSLMNWGHDPLPHKTKEKS